jgi:hypothetical protein
MRTRAHTRKVSVLVLLAITILVLVAAQKPASSTSVPMPNQVVSGARSGGVNVSEQRDVQSGVRSSAAQMIAPVDPGFSGAPPDQPLSGTKP